MIGPSFLIRHTHLSGLNPLLALGLVHFVLLWAFIGLGIGSIRPNIYQYPKQIGSSDLERNGEKVISHR
ncbi:unnamed protein product [Cuscuta campestris]|uniref:Uncharacterized protein n=1 Tax=Cuscuta campestris TaxID=132261 RepID=A0A484LUJ9_9ASTE|nr:unnamed protein product [Cuscuta campestris]